MGDIFNGIDLDKVKKLYDVSTQKIQKYKDCWAAKLCSFFFKQILNLTDEFCQKSSDNVCSDLKYYIEKVKDNKDITTFLENMSIE